MRYLGLLGSKGRRTGKEKRFGILHYEKRSGVERGIYFLPPHRWPYYIKRQILMIPKQVEHIWLLKTIFCCFHHITDYFNEEVWRKGGGGGLRVEYGFCLLIFFPLKLTQPTLICGGRSEVRKWWNVKGTYLEAGGEGEWEEEGGWRGGGDGKSNTF